MEARSMCCTNGDDLRFSRGACSHQQEEGEAEAA
jgi:hypothetical protein